MKWLVLFTFVWLICKRNSRTSHCSMMMWPAGFFVPILPSESNSKWRVQGPASLQTFRAKTTLLPRPQGFLSSKSNSNNNNNNKYSTASEQPGFLLFRCKRKQFLKFSIITIIIIIIIIIIMIIIIIIIGLCSK